MKTFRVYYQKPIVTIDHVTKEKHDKLIFDPEDSNFSVKTLNKTHVMLGVIVADDLEAVFNCMQGENWSAKGNARPLIKSLGLSHTSMSVCDVVYDTEDKKYFIVDRIGFKELKQE